MRPVLPKYSLVAGVLGGCAAFCLLYHLRHRESQALDWFRQTNAQMQYAAYQRDQLRREDSQQKTPASATSVITPSRTGYRDEGQATPHAAVQTLAWACEQADTSAVVRLLHFDAAQRLQAEALLAALPPEHRLRWQNVETMAADLFILGRLARPLPPADVLAAVPIEHSDEAHATLLTPRQVRLCRVKDAWACQVDCSGLEALSRQLLGTLRTGSPP